MLLTSPQTDSSLHVFLDFQQKVRAEQHSPGCGLSPSAQPAFEIWQFSVLCSSTASKQTFDKEKSLLQRVDGEYILLW